VTTRHSGSHATGFALIEIMVALVIGLMVVGAVLTTYLGNGQTGRLQSATAQMDEDAQIGLRILTRDLMMAGYGAPISVDADTLVFNKTPGGRTVLGCDKGFSAAPSSSPSACAGSGGLPSIEVVYQATIYNTPLSDGKPTDCAGVPVPASQQGITYNRYGVGSSTAGRSELRCSSGNSTVPLVDNAERLQFWYGQAGSAELRQVLRYTGAVEADFSRVVSVRVCLLMRSTEAVVSAEEAALTSYLDCDAVRRTSTDGRLRRAYFSTIALRSKLPL
jgi:type IV pilus assembly protein PilW